MKNFTVWAFAILAATGSLAEDAGRWTFSGGVQMRRIAAEFSAPSPGGLPTWMNIHGTRGGQGAQVLYDGVTPRLEYADGVIIFDPNWSPVDGTAYFGFQNASQVGTDPANGYDTITFSSHLSVISSHVSESGLNADDDAWAGQPVVRTSWALVRRPAWNLALFAAYGLAGADLNSDRHITATQTIVRHDIAGRFEYDYDPLAFFTPAPPFEAPGDGAAWVIFDPDLYNTRWPGSDAQSPKASVGGPRLVIDRLIARSRADLDVTLHEIMFGASLAIRPASRLSVAINAGPTLNWLSWDLEGTTSWESEKTGAVLASARDTESDTDVVFGAAVELAVQLDLDAAGRFYLEASGGYRWVETVKAGAGAFKADIDASSFAAGAAFGLRM